MPANSVVDVRDLKHRGFLIKNLLEISRRIVVSLNRDDILQAAVDGVATVVGLDTAAVYILEGARLQLCSTMPPIPDDFPDALRFAEIDDHPHICQAINNVSPVIIEDAAKVVLSEAEHAVVDLRNLRSLLFLPLIAEAEVLGAMVVGSIDVPVALDESSVGLSFTLANMAALAVKNAQLFTAGKKYAAQLEQTLAERLQAEVERNTLQEQLLQVQKMDAIGQLAGGIAHDFNNLLSGIIGNAELMLVSTDNEELRGYANEIIHIGERVGDLNAQLLSFSRKTSVQKAEVNLHTVINDVISILQHTINKNVEIRTNLEADQFLTEGDAAQIQSAFLNLAVNARDAMPDGGILEISSAIKIISEETQRIDSFEITPGKYAELSFSDTGVGIDAEITKRIYEPFFTTKKKGEGTGMGLAAVYGTMMAHKGAIQVESTPGQGTVFRLYFPVCVNNDDSTERIDTVNECGRSLKEKKCTSKKILVIDDEEIVATVVSAHLRHTGYEVEVFTDSSAALAYFKVNHQGICLVILDMIMPGLDGAALFHGLKQTDPAVNVVLSSGYSVTSTLQGLLKAGAKAFIAKPYHKSELLSVINDVLASSENIPFPQ